MNKKHVLKVLTTAALLGSYAIPVNAAPTFSDINNSYAKNAILELVGKGIINGVGGEKFNPTANITRQDFAIILAKTLNLDVSSAPASPTFSDIPPSHYAYQAVEAAVKAGLVSGIGDGKFGTGQNLTREQMAVFFVRALGVDATGKAENLTFTDKASIADYAKDAVAAAVELGLIHGTPGGEFNPKAQTTRQDVAAVASNFIKASDTIRSANTPKPPINPAPVPPQNNPVPTPPSTNRDRSTGGGSGSIRDMTSPIVTLVTSGSVVIGDLITVKSTESGTVYLIPAADNPTSGTALEAIVSSERGTKAAVTSAGVNVTLSTLGLPAGEYKVYAIDGSGNVSVPTSILALQASTSPAQDTIPPVATLVTVDTVRIGDPVTVQSNEPGAVYLIASTNNPMSQEDLENFIKNHKGAKSPVESAGTNVVLDTSELEEGEYRVYAVDAAGNVSNPTSTLSLRAPVPPVSEMAAPIISFTSADTIVFDYEEELDNHSVPATSDIIVINSDNESMPLPDDSIRIENTKVIIRLSSSVGIQEPIRVRYIRGGNPIRSTSGELSPAIEEQTIAYSPDNQNVGAVDKSILNTKIEEATSLKNAAEPGTTSGKYPQSAIDALDTAILAANSVEGDAQSTQQMVDNAVVALQQAMTAFQNAMVQPLTVSLAPGASFVLNSGRTGTAADTTLKDDSGMQGFQNYNKRNIKNFLQIKRGVTVENIKYNTNTHDFDVIDANQVVLGSVSLDSTSPEVQINTAADGLTVHPLDSADESTLASLVFHVNENGTEVGNVTLPITMDQTAPTFVSSSYNSGVFTLTASEPLVVQPFPPVFTRVEYSEIGDFSDTVVLQSGVDYSFNQSNGDRFTVALGNETMDTLMPEASSKFRIIVTGYTDYADNPINGTVIVDVPHF